MTDETARDVERVARAMTEDERGDAEFRLKDQAWSALVAVFEDRKLTHGVNYASVGRRIRVRASQIELWLSAPEHMTLRIIGMLAAGLDVRMTLRLDEIAPATAAITAMQPAINAAVLAERERCAGIVASYLIYEGSDHPVCKSIIRDIKKGDAIRKEPT